MSIDGAWGSMQCGAPFSLCINFLISKVIYNEIFKVNNNKNDKTQSSVGDVFNE